MPKSSDVGGKETKGERPAEKSAAGSTPSGNQESTAAQTPPPAVVTMQDFEERMRQFEDRVLGRVAQFVNPQRPQAEAPVVPEVSEEDIEKALEEGEPKKAAKLLAKWQQAQLSRLEQRFTSHLGEATRLVADRLGKLASRTARELPYYEKFGREIDDIIKERGLDATDPDVLATVHDLVAARHMKEIIQEEVEKARRAALDEGEEQALQRLGGRRRRAPSPSEQQEYREVPVSDALMDELERMGFEDENEFAKSRGFEDPSGKGRHWDYMHHVGRMRERAHGMGEGLKGFVARLREQTQRRRPEMMQES